MRGRTVLALCFGIAAAAGLGCGSPTVAAGGSGGAGNGNGNGATGGNHQTGAGGTAGLAGGTGGGSGPNGSGGAAPSGSGGAAPSGSGGAAPSGSGGAAPGGSGGSGGSAPIGNPGGPCAVPAAAAAADVSHPTTVVGDGTPASCTAAKVAAAVAGGGVVTFDCGPDPLTIVVPEIEIINDGGVTKDGSVTIDGGGKITLSGGGKNRILRQNTCDSTLHYTSTRCDLQATPHLVVQNIKLTAGVALADQVDADGLFGGGALYVQGGTFKAVNITVSDSQQTNAAGQLVQDLAGGAIYALEINGPAYIVNSRFESNSGINGGALGSISVSWTILDSLFMNNTASGHGENPAASGTEGGGLGGAIYNDGNDYTLTICGSQLIANQANELGSGAIVQVVDNLNGDLIIDQSTLTGNSDNGDVQRAANHPGIFVEARDMANGTSGVMITGTTFN
jgi:hypothetical protein